MTKLMTLALLLLVVVSNAQETVYSYPATLDSIYTIFSAVYECAAKVDVKPYDIHVSQLSEEAMILKISPKHFVPFVREVKNVVGAPLVEVRRFEKNTTTLATFTYTLTWPGPGKTTAIDDQLQVLTMRGIPVEKPKMEIVVIAVGDPDLPELTKLMTEESIDAGAKDLP